MSGSTPGIYLKLGEGVEAGFILDRRRYRLSKAEMIDNAVADVGKTRGAIYHPGYKASLGNYDSQASTYFLQPRNMRNFTL